MRILVACEFSGVVREAFTKMGHDATSCDLLPTEIPGKHYQGDVRDILYDNWDIIIAHPPCTYLSNAGARWLYPHKGELDEIRYSKGLEAKEFFMLFYKHSCPRIAIENPVPSLAYQMPPGSQDVQPWMFGHPYTKRTRLWLKGLPNLVPTIVVNPIGPFCPSGTGRKMREKYGSAKRGDDAKNRSITFEGLAQAMASQWGQ